jgi:hypothetical protein
MHDLGKTTNSNSTPHRPRRPENQFPKRAMFQMRVRVSVDRIQCITYQCILRSCKLFVRPYCSVFCNGGHLAKLELACIDDPHISLIQPAGTRLINTSHTFAVRVCTLHVRPTQAAVIPLTLVSKSNIPQPR